MFSAPFSSQFFMIVYTHSLLYDLRIYKMMTMTIKLSYWWPVMSFNLKNGVYLIECSKALISNNALMSPLPGILCSSYKFLI
jgi:hypothetical protein